MEGGEWEDDNAMTEFDIGSILSSAADPITGMQKLGGRRAIGANRKAAGSR